MSASQVAIVIPCHKSALDPFERIAWRRILELYGHLPIVLMAPPDLDVSTYSADHPRLRVERFEFRTVRDYSQLLLQSYFYERFREFTYILIHQLDAYLLKDELLHWCGKGYDYVGAPLFHGFEPAEPAGRMWRAGNGGFSLRKVTSALAVLASTRRYRTPSQHWAARPPAAGFGEAARWAMQSCGKFIRFHNDVRWAALSNFHEDVFWSVEAAHFWPEFRVSGLDDGLRFAFDYAPAHCFRVNGGELPFGCHAWPRYDLDFWRRFIPVDSSP